MSHILKEKIEILPDLPGCYIYKDVNNDVIYVGKAKNLKNRVKSYFSGAHNKKTQSLVSNITDIDFILVTSEKEALILENNLIKKYKPYYNIKLKDDKSYPYLVITKELHPRLLITRNYKKKSKNLYFGPYVDSYAVSNLKKLLDKIYPLRKCNPVEKRPCTYYQIGECIGPCAKKISSKEYDDRIHKIKKFLSGDTDEILTELNSTMEKYVEKLEFENAAKIYGYIKSINVSIENQLINSNNTVARDYIGYYYDNNYLCVQIFISRNGNIIERQIEYFDLYETYDEILYSYLIQYYSLNQNPKEIYILDVNNELLEDVLMIKVLSPTKGKNHDIISIVTNNAKYYLENQIYIEEIKKEKKFFVLKNLAEKLGVNSISNIDAFDNSNIMGKDPVSVKVNYLNGEKNTYGYRRFKINDNQGINDIKTLKEVLYRTYKNKDTLCNLIIVDGGENHVKAASDVIHNKLDLNIKIIGLVKNEKHITEYIITDDFEIINLEKNSEEYLFLKRIQDEVHRFAITYHRNTKKNNTFKSKLDDIKGIGIKRKQLLMMSFSSIDEIRNASTEKLQKIGIPKKVIDNIKKQL